MDTQWIRLYPPGRGRWLVLAWEVASMAMLSWTTADLFDLTSRGTAVLNVLLALVWGFGAWRIAGMGVYVSEHSVRMRGLFRSQTLGWQEIASFRLHQATHRLGGLRIPGDLTVLIERCDGATVNTELWAQGVDFHSRPGLFRAVFHDLRERHLAATRLAPRRPSPA